MSVFNKLKFQSLTLRFKSNKLNSKLRLFNNRLFSTIKVENNREYLIVDDPYEGDQHHKIPLSTFEESNELLQKCSKAQEEWWNSSNSPETGKDIRIDACRELIENFKYLKDSFAGEMTFTMGKPYHQGLHEVEGMIERAEGMIDLYDKYFEMNEILDYPILSNGNLNKNIERRIRKLPLGVVFIISPWNYPLLCSINSIIPAILCGNSVMLKCSSRCPKISELFERSFSMNKTLFPNGILTPLHCNHKVVSQLLNDKSNSIGYTVFTGSVNGGLQIQESCVNKLYMNTTLELGGKDPVYVHNDCNIEHSAFSIVDGSMYNAGQSCCAVERCYVHDDIYDRFTEACIKFNETLVIGPPMDDTTTLGPLANESQLDFLESQIDDALSKGAVLLSGTGKRCNDERRKGRFFCPTILGNCNHSMRVMKEESFGPILPIQKVSNDILETIELMNDSDYGLTAAIFTKDRELVNVMGDNIKTGTIFMNRCDYLDPQLPWSGVKDTGKGISLSKHCFNSFVNLKGYNYKLVIDHDPSESS